MGNKKITDSSIPAITTIVGNELIPAVTPGVNGTVTPNAILNYIGANISDFIFLYDTETNWVSSNPLITEGYILVSNDDMVNDPKFKITDGVNTWADLPYFYTKRGLIQIVDLDGDFFTDLTTARAYVASFNVAGIISNESFIQPAGATGGIYFFTVPKNTDFSGDTYFLGDVFVSKPAYIIDKLGLITSFGTHSFFRNLGNNILGHCSFGTLSFNNSTGNNILGNCSFISSGFASSTGNNILGNCTFGANAFLTSTGNNTLGNCSFGTNAFNNSSGKYSIGDITLASSSSQFASNSSGEFTFRGNIGTTEGNDYSNFFNTNTATIRANRAKYTSNSGAIEGDLLLAQTNGATLFFGGIDKLDKKNRVTDFSSPNNNDIPTTQATIDLVDNRVQSNIKIIGDWDATSGSMPLDDESNTTPFITMWGSTIKQGWAFRVGYGQAGTVGGFDYEEGDVVYALLDNAGATPADWGDLDHNLQQATETLRGTGKVITAAIIADETNTDDQRFVTGIKLWQNFWPRVLAIAHTFAAKITFSTAPRFSSVTASEYLKVDGNKDLSSVSAIPATDVTEDSTHRFITDVERLKWNKFSYTDTVLGTATSGTGNQFSKSVLIPANTVTNGALNIKGRSVKVGSSSFAWLNIYVNTSNSLSGATLLGQINNSGNNTLRNFSLDRTIPIQSGSFTAFIINVTTGYEEVITNAVTTVTIDWTVDQYVILSCQCNVGTETMRANFLSVVQH